MKKIKSNPQNGHYPDERPIPDVEDNLYNNPDERENQIYCPKVKLIKRKSNSQNNE